MDIARVVGASDKKDGYCTGNGYMVTWALGHLVSLAMPGTYGYTKTTAEDLPMLPHPFRLVSRQVRTDKGMVTDLAAARQLKVIDSVLAQCDSVIVATDCAREGELIFRWIYSYLGYTKPFKRLWISSLTDEAIREGLANLREGKDYDSLYAAADCRAKADWLVGMNASRALAIVSGSANNSIGRVQTPTLAMVCARFKENRGFVSTPYWQLHLTLEQRDRHRMFIHTEEFKEKETAEAAYKRITSGSVAAITKVERRKTFQQAPLLYDLTSLQKDCNIHYDLTADKTLSIAQALYEKKLISYPRTGSRHIPGDVMRHIPSLLEKVAAMPEFKEYGQHFDLSDLNTRSVDDAKVTDHHALIITGIVPEGLSEAESVVYGMIAGRMLESFSPPCEKDLLVMECTARGWISVPVPPPSPNRDGAACSPERRTRRKTNRSATTRPRSLPKARPFRSWAGAEEDPAQTAVHGSHPAGGDGDLREKHHGRTGEGGHQGLGHRHACYPCRHHHHPDQA